MKRRNLLVPSLFVLLVLVFFSGPKATVDPQPFSRQLPADLQAYLTASEAAFPDITPGAEKTIIWAHPEQQQTELSIVYLHGFSATRQETAPLCDELAKALGANLFYTRLSGHGRSSRALGEVGAGEWLRDAREALAIGQRLGRKVLIVGTSTGGTLAAWLAATQNDAPVLAYVLISPNFSPRDRAAQVLTWPWASTFAPLLLGTERQWKPLNDEQARYWTHRYPTQALLPMMALVNAVNELPLEQVQAPILLIHANDDQVVSSHAAATAFSRFGSQIKQRVELRESQDPSHHVLAGRIVAPQDTARVALLIEQFVQPLLATKPETR